MFKNLTVFRIGPDWAADLLQAEAPLLESIAGQWLMRLMVEQRVVPGAVVKRRTDEIADQLEQSTGRRPGRRQTKELKEQALLELLPQAFTKRASIGVWLSPTDRWLIVDTGSATRADEVVTLLVKALPGLSVQALHTNESPAAVMSDWLLSGEPAADFTVDRECELKTPDEMKSVVRYARHPLDIEEVREHIRQGKVPTRLALTWNARIAFTLTDLLQIRRIEFLDGVFEDDASVSKEERFDADAAIATAELRRLLPALVEALGGEHLPAS